jgi:hypothetical protein
MGNNENPTNNTNHSADKPQIELFNNYNQLQHEPHPGQSSNIIIQQYNQLQHGSLFEQTSSLLCEAVSPRVSTNCDAVSCSRNRHDLI